MQIVSARIAETGVKDAGRNYGLTCSFTRSASSTTSAAWSHNNGVGGGRALQSGPTLNFTPLRLSDAGIYTCEISGVFDSITMTRITYSNTRNISISGKQ